MKKLHSVLALALALLMLVPCFASAVSFTAQADAMKDMGLFLGTNNGYDLDKEPTRAQAAVMLVRFLGKEAEAKAGEWETPFTDVPDWAKPYVGYLYENDLTKGMSETTFVPDDVCSAQMYVTFILRALGYMDENGKDTFEYAKVFDFAEEKNLITAENCDKDNFLRDHMVGIAYRALTLPTADGTYALLASKLWIGGSITREDVTNIAVSSANMSIRGDVDPIIVDYVNNTVTIDGTQNTVFTLNGVEYKLPNERFSLTLTDAYTVYFNRNTCRFVSLKNTKDPEIALVPVIAREGENVKTVLSYIEMKKDTSLSKLKCATFGDSITWYDGNAYNWGKEQGRTAVGYQSYMRKYLGMNVTNFGYSGYTMPQIIAQLKAKQLKNYDLITITSGANDERCGTALGEIKPIGSNFNTNTYIGALQSGIEYAQKNSPDAKILLITPIYGWFYAPNGYDRNPRPTTDGVVTDIWANAMKEVAELYGLPVCDLYEKGGFNINNRLIYMNDPEPNNGNYLYSLHPSSTGYQRMAAEIMNSILEISFDADSVNKPEDKPAENNGELMSFAEWTDDGMSAIYYISEEMYNSFVYTDETYEFDGRAWKCVDTYTLTLTLNWSSGESYNFGKQWGGDGKFFADHGDKFGYEDPDARFCTAVYDINGDGTDEYLASFPYSVMLGDSTIGGWMNGETVLTWQTVNGSESDPVTYEMMVINE